MPTTEFESSVTLSMETWNMALMITDSQHEAQDLVETICHGVTHLPDNQQSMAVMMHINLLASKVMTRH